MRNESGPPNKVKKVGVKPAFIYSIQPEINIKRRSILMKNNRTFKYYTIALFMKNTIRKAKE